MYIHSRPEGSTVSRYETLKQVEKSTGKTPTDLLDCPELSSDCFGAWSAFNSLVEYNYREIESYCNLTGNELACWEVEAIMTLAKYKEVTPVWPLK